MPHLVYRAAARRDIAEIAAYVERESESRAVADAFVDKITDYCEHLATLSTMIGRPRRELRPALSQRHLRQLRHLSPLRQ